MRSALDPPIRPALAAGLLSLTLALLAVACGRPNAAEREAAAVTAAASAVPAAEASIATDPIAPPLGDGFVVWESNRGGAWRLWIRDLAAAAAPRQLSPDEPGRVHCCPHLSPDGSRLAFLSLPPGGEAYRPGHTTGPLRLLDLASGEDRVLAPAARTYYENRAVVWRNDSELIYIAGDGRTMLLELASGEARRLTERAASEHGWLISPDLATATTGRPAFSPYDRASLVVAERSARGGCQPYFSSDGRWGFWVAGAGGPINRLDLASGVVATILRKNDSRMVDGYGYAYFPMFSADRRAFVYAASSGDHNHVAADYEIFLAASDPDTLELIGSAHRLTRHPATDRFPDVHLAPQPLGRHDGEAPFALALEANPAGADWRWDFGDGAPVRDGEAVARHVYERPGVYRIAVVRDGERRTGTVRVRPAAPPTVSAVEVAAAGDEVRVWFDEEVDAPDARVAFASGLEVGSWSLSPDRRSLIVRPVEPLTRFDRLELAGIRDRAQRPNAMAPVTLEVEPPRWPLRRQGLLFVWRTGDAPNLFFDAAAGVERSGLVEPSGRAFLDRERRMALRGGIFTASPEDSNRLRWALQASNELALELTVEPAAPPGGGERALVLFGQRGQPHNFALLERDGELVYSQRVLPHGADVYAVARLGPLPAGRRHLVLSYSPGRLTLDVDGERTVDTAEVQGDFFHWRSLRLAFGGRAGGGLEWSGALEGIALYDRVLSAAEAQESFRRYRRLLERRQPVPELVVEARLVERSPTPTLADIRPYRHGLAVHRYAIERVVSGEVSDPAAREVLVAHWELLDGARQPAAERRIGDRVTLRLEPFAAQPQLEAIFLSNRFGSAPRFFAVDGDWGG